jgi:hypothetical protein
MSKAKYDRLEVDRTLTISGTTTDSSTATRSGTNTFTGAVAFSGAVSNRKQVEIKASGSETLLTADAPKVMIATEAGVQTFTLPSAATAGLEFTFICGNASGEILITPIAGQDIVGMTLATGGAGIDTADAAGIKNTAGTNVLGDACTIVSDGVSRWYMHSITGIWAAQ